MICFRDMSFCSSSKLCANTGCERRLGQREKIASREWWGGDGAPIAYVDFKAPDCGYQPILRGDDS